MNLEREWIEELVFGTELVRRFIQDSPILPDVWFGYAENLGQQLDLLLTPYREVNPGDLGLLLHKQLQEERQTPRWQNRHEPEASSAKIAYNQANVVARLWFDELIRVVLPLTSWLADTMDQSDQTQLGPFIEALTNLKPQDLADIFKHPARVKEKEFAKKVPPELIWMIRLIGSFEVARENQVEKKTWEEWSDKQRLSWWQEIQENPTKMLQAAMAIMTDMALVKRDKPPLWTVSRNRTVRMSILRSVSAVKADAAFRLFNLSCKDLTWAIIDSGIDAKHKAFRQKREDGNFYEKPFVQDGGRWKNQTRITATYDFTRIRDLLSLDGTSNAQIPESLRQRFEQDLDELHKNLSRGREIDWTIFEPFLRVPHEDEEYISPAHEHGTHVAGILAADLQDGQKLQGVCPDINLYDLRVIKDNGEGDEFSVIAALQLFHGAAWGEFKFINPP
jgi:hypothetical protein